VQAEGVGFEPTEGLTLQRFSRPSQSTTLAPLRISIGLDAGRGPTNHGFTSGSLTDFLDDVFGHVDGDVDRHGQRDRVAGPRVDFENLALVADPQLGEIRMIT
jgi:hypothetical protein